ncbi:protein FAM107B isoform X2 [Toxorhynchites rutilus septentrionalis]|nr:protein FAM107B isoform X2 [Toxorhynchites rutilus septentrionalis]XP_055622913.1 protein FAM107B isoform X2 [Toxorhynchites rutilus septentrionalis]XP_055622916.1 protein FAM107B isoform X2 [Toxorhynchites rutilus septentrionalis]
MMPPINHAAASGAMTDAQGLIVPKKITNPCLESMDRQNLHRELMFNQKMGKNVLNQKSELQRALEKQKERQVLAAQNLAKQQAQEQSIANELGRVIMQRAARLEQKNLAAAAAGNQQDQADSINPEYLNARAKLRATTAVFSK